MFNKIITLQIYFRMNILKHASPIKYKLENIIF